MQVEGSCKEVESSEMVANTDSPPRLQVFIAFAYSETSTKKSSPKACGGASVWMIVYYKLYPDAMGK